MSRSSSVEPLRAVNYGLNLGTALSILGNALNRFGCNMNDLGPLGNPAHITFMFLFRIENLDSEV